MAIYKCKMCGGTLEISGESSVATCEYCGSVQTLPKKNDEVLTNLFNRANNLRIKCEFDKAADVYEKILNEDNNDSEAHWGLVLCKYGIEYVEDPKTYKRIPTCHRTQYESILTDVDYLAAVSNADSVSADIYKAQAEEIANLQKDILAIVKNEKPFDVFICYKETDENGKRTVDSALANDIYYQLTQEGMKVFYAAITLEDKLGVEYEPYIFAALNSAKVMLVVGTKAEYFDAVWVKNEWSRYLKLMKNDRSKLLVPCYRDMDAYDLPEEFSHLQAQDMSKIGFVNDVVRGIKKVIKADEPKVETVVKETVVASDNTNVAPLLKRAFMFLEDGDWKSADEYCEKALDIDPECAEAYLGKLMADLNINKKELLKDCAEPFNGNNNYIKAYRFGDEALKSELDSFINIIIDRNENARLSSIYGGAVSLMNSAVSDKAFRIAAEKFNTIKHYKDSALLAGKCLEKAEDARKDHIYMAAKTFMNNNLISSYENAVKSLNSISGWKDSDELVSECERKIKELKAKNEKEHIEAEKNKKQIIKIVKIVSPIVAAFVLFLIILNSYILPSNKYKQAEDLLSNGEYASAINVFKDLSEKDFKDSEQRMIDCKTSWYNYAMELVSNKKYSEAIFEFQALGNYKDSNKQIDICNREILNLRYEDAVKLYKEGKYTDAINILEDLGDFENSPNKIKEVKLNYAKFLFKEEKYNEAKEIFDSLEQYEDAVHCSYLCDDKINGIDRDALKKTLKEAKINSIVKYGRYNSKPIEWIVAEKKDGKALLISKYNLSNVVYKDFILKHNSHLTNDATWSGSDARKHCESFYNSSFIGSEKEMIVCSEVYTPYEIGVHKYNPVSYDYVFLLSKEEVNKYFKSDSSKVAADTDNRYEYKSYWLRTPSSGMYAYYVYYGEFANAKFHPGLVDDKGTRSNLGFRPAMWVAYE